MALQGRQPRSVAFPLSHGVARRSRVDSNHDRIAFGIAETKCTELCIQQLQSTEYTNDRGRQQRDQCRARQYMWSVDQVWWKAESRKDARTIGVLVFGYRRRWINCLRSGHIDIFGSWIGYGDDGRVYD